MGKKDARRAPGALLLPLLCSGVPWLCPLGPEVGASGPPLDQTPGSAGSPPFCWTGRQEPNQSPVHSGASQVQSPSLQQQSLRSFAATPVLQEMLTHLKCTEVRAADCGHLSSRRLEPELPTGLPCPTSYSVLHLCQTQPGFNPMTLRSQTCALPT